MFTGSIYFLGKFRPLFVEDDALENIELRMRRAVAGVSDTDMRDWLIDRASLAAAEFWRGNCSSVTIDHCDRGVRISSSARDPWIEKAAAKLPECPGLDYNV